MNELRSNPWTGFVSALQRVLTHLCAPETDVGAVLRGVARDGRVVRDRQALHATLPDRLVRVGDGLDVAVEPDGISDVETGDLPRLKREQGSRRGLTFSRSSHGSGASSCSPVLERSCLKMP